jgi:hypothetical protein
LLEISTEVVGELARRRRCEPKAHLQVLVGGVHRRPTVAGAVEVEYDLSHRKAKKVKKILEHKDTSLTDTPTGRRAIY